MNDAACDSLERHFDTAFAAPDGIKKLRELILTLAMQGKLVAQDPNDPPASQLLKEIEAEKKRLVKEGKIKAPKLLPEIKPEEVPYALPQNWKWVRFGEIAQHNSGKTLDKGRNTGLPRDYITTSNLYWGRFELASVRQMLIREEELEKCSAKKNDLLICEGGEAGRAAVWSYESEVCFQNHVHRARFYGDVDPYLAYRFFEKLNATGEINQHRKGVGISNMSSAALASIIFPLPPLPEQLRIVAKIDQLMARCDELEKLRDEREQKRRSVHTAALKQLLDAQAGDSFADAWQFITQHFGELYAVRENVTELRKAILQLAVMGKLVPQNPNDPPASQLLKEIEAEKKRLVKEGKIKAPKPLPEIKPEEVPYALPQGWAWVRLGELFKVTSGKNLPKDKMQEGLIPVYGGNGITGYHNDFNTDKPTIVIGRVGYYCGSIHLTPAKAWITDNAFFTIYDEERLYRDYVIWLFKTIDLQVDTSSTAQPVISGGKIYPIPIPIPPLSEQHHIVAKIDSLMALCDTLEQQIDATTRKQTALLDAVMTQA